jgi:hypothetical protein
LHDKGSRESTLAGIGGCRPYNLHPPNNQWNNDKRSISTIPIALHWHEKLKVIGISAQTMYVIVLLEKKSTIEKNDGT